MNTCRLTERSITVKTIVSPAVKCKPINSTQDYVIVTGSCHSNCFEALSFGFDMYVLACPDKYDYAEGYVCDDGTFVDRIEAMTIAKEANQVKSMYKSDDYISLQSYMLV